MNQKNASGNTLQNFIIYTLQKIILYLQKIQLQYITYLLLEECRKQQFKNCLKSCSGL